MSLTPGYSSEKTENRERVTAVLSDELKNHMFIYAVLMIIVSAAGDFFGESFAPVKGIFVLAVLFFCAFAAVLEHCAKLIKSGLLPIFISVLPGAIFAFLIRQQEDMSYLFAAAILSILLRLFIGLVPVWKKIVLYGSFVLTAVAVYLDLGLNAFSGKSVYELFMFVCLVTLSLSSLQRLVIERGKTSFPFSYFLILSILLLIIPVNDEPIDWTGVIRAGQRIAQSADYALSSVSYFFTEVLDLDTNSTGYSSLTKLGGNSRESGTVQLFLRTAEKPYVIFEDAVTGEKMKRKRALYLAGAKGVDREAIVDFLLMLQNGKVDRETAMLFSHISDVNVEYGYLRTRDEIAPSYSIILSSNGKKIEDGRSRTIHRKGYQIRAKYLDIDFGSPYLMEVYKDAASVSRSGKVSYDALAEYVRELYRVDLKDIVAEDEYEAILEENARLYGISIGAGEKDKASESAGDGDLILPDSLDVTGAGEELRALTYEITRDYDNDYDKCRAIEEYLRQYTYSLQVSEGGSVKADMATAEGMSRLAESFLFDAKKGYCIHYASAMVMMLRLSGIPARAAFGFCYLYPFEEEEFYTVEGNRAHVWPEAYIPNAGWIPFEPTSAYPTAVSLTWNKAPKKGEGKAGASYYRGPGLKVGGEDEDEIKEPDLRGKDEEHDDENRSRRALYIAVSLMIFGAVLFILLVLLNALAQKLRYRLGAPDEKLRISVEQIKKLIRKYSGESLPDRGFLSDFLGKAPVQLRPDIEKIFYSYYALEYRGSEEPPVSIEDVEKAREVTGMLKKTCRENKKAKGIKSLV